ncbi:MAG: hypothetical protein AAF937_09925 [Planctomycetota bacterium]
MHRARGQVGRTQAGGLSLLLAVALLAAAGSGVETARRVAFAGAGLAYAVCADVPRVGPTLVEQRAPVLVGIGKPVRTIESIESADAPPIGVLVVSGSLDLPPPSLVA